MQYGLIGAKLGHSFSKQIHESLCAYSYELCPLPTPAALDAFLQKRAFKAINVTLPYKQDVIDYCAQVDAHAAAIGAVNTILNRAGKLYGYNTDYAGFAFLAAQAGVTFAGKHVLVLGTGGTQKTVCAVAQDAGAASITLVSRTAAPNFDACAPDHTARGGSTPYQTPCANANTSPACGTPTFSAAIVTGNGLNARTAAHPVYPTITYEQARALVQTNIILNTTPCGMYPSTAAQPLALDAFPALTGVLDVVYNPLRTRLVQEARARGIPAAGGLVMLAAQAKYAAELFTDTKIPNSEITRVWRELLYARTNLVLIGMPGSGKTHVGRLAAAALGRPFVDLDAEILTRTGRPIADIFATDGEQAFRDWESTVCADIARETGQVIATGGGAILRAENVQALRQNGVLIHLARPLAALQTGYGRPLSTDAATVRTLFETRAPLYRAAADKTVQNNGTPEDAAQAAKEALYEIAHTQRA